MSAPYSWLKNSSHFGFRNDTTNAWKTVTPSQEWMLAAAQQQHELALAVREWKSSNRQSDKVLAQALDVHPETVGRYLRGETGLDLATFNHLAHLIGQQATFTLDSLLD